MLTAKQEMFAQGILEGKTQAEAYRCAYNCERMKDKTVWEKASRLMAKDDVATRIKELRDLLAKPSIMTAHERLEYLTRVIKGEELEKVVQVVNGKPIEVDVTPALKTKLNAIDIMNKMQGEYVQKVEGNIKTTAKLEDIL